MLKISYVKVERSVCVEIFEDTNYGLNVPIY